MSQWLEYFLPRLATLVPFSGPNILERQNWLVKNVPWPLHEGMACVYTHIWDKIKYNQNKEIRIYLQSDKKWGCEGSIVGSVLATHAWEPGFRFQHLWPSQGQHTFLSKLWEMEKDGALSLGIEDLLFARITHWSIARYSKVRIMLESEEIVNSVCLVSVFHWLRVKIMRKPELWAGSGGSGCKVNRRKELDTASRSMSPTWIDGWGWSGLVGCRVTQLLSSAGSLWDTLTHQWQRVTRWFASLAMTRYTNPPAVITRTEIFIKDYGADSLKSDF